jgi:hypothetical protein
VYLIVIHSSGEKQGIKGTEEQMNTEQMNDEVIVKYRQVFPFFLREEGPSGLTNCVVGD